MEFINIILFSIFSFLCIIISIALTIIAQKNPSKSKKSSRKLPPGPWKLPLIGNIHQFMASSQLPHHKLRNLANKYGSLMKLQLGEKLHIIVSSPEMAKEIMKTHDAIFANRPHILVSDMFAFDNSDIVYSPNGNYWRQMKKLCISKLLTPTRLQLFRYIREDEVSKLVRTIHTNEGSIFNLSIQIVLMVNDIISRAMLGKRYKDQMAFLSVLGQISEPLAGFSIVDFFPSIKILPLITGIKDKFEKLQKENDRVLENIIKDHMGNYKRGHNNEFELDLLEALLNDQEIEELKIHNITSNNIKAVIWDMLVGGTGAPSITIIWAMSELMKNPNIMEKAQIEVRKIFDTKGYVDETDLHKLKYLNSVIKETLRLHPPEVLSIQRENSEKCIINGYEIPYKSTIIVNAWAIGRDPKYWNEAERFMPERFLDSTIDFKGTDFEYIPFGSGRRMCPAISFAMSYVELALANLLYHFDWKLPNGMRSEELDMTERFGLLVGKKNDLLLIPTAYYPSELLTRTNRPNTQSMAYED